MQLIRNCGTVQQYSQVPAEATRVDPLQQIPTEPWTARLPKWVIRVSLAPRPLLPIYPEQRTSQDRPGWSVSCQQATFQNAKSTMSAR